MSLNKYNQKRNFSKTVEPVGELKRSHKKLKFVVQHHMARKDHYDFRLEYNGVLKSWAVPKGPSYDSKDKRLAIMVEDHPLSYANFEGTIPKGQYGGGTVMLWDEGRWIPNEKPDFKKEIKFTLEGKRLKGNWTLVHFKEDNWLLIKERDGIKGYRDINKFKTSIKTGRTMSEIENNKKVLASTNLKENIVLGTTITNPEKVIFTKPVVTKMDIILYYEKVASRMMPYLNKRLISTVRAPEGVKGSRFFKKHLETKHKGIGKKILRKNNDKRNDYYYIKDEEGLISEVQMNSYEIHIWGSKITNINAADILVFDLDPDEGIGLSKVREGVKDLKSILDDLKLTSYLKTSGGKGYHVVVPLKPSINWSKASIIAKNIAKLMEEKWPDKYTSNMRKNKRKNKIFIDWVRNTVGATSVAPYSIRLRDKLAVSMPIKWSELDKVKPDGITLEEAIRRLKLKDPWKGFGD